MSVCEKKILGSLVCARKKGFRVEGLEFSVCVEEREDREKEESKTHNGKNGIYSKKTSPMS